MIENNHSRKYRILLILFLLFSAIFLTAGEDTAGNVDVRRMSYEELVNKYRQLGEVKEFLKTDTPGKYPWSMHRFFDHTIYEKLLGNEFFGYYHDEGIVYRDKHNRIAVDTIGVIKGRGWEKYQEQYTRVFLESLKAHAKHTYHVERYARYSLGICIVSVKETGDTRSPAGVVLETYIKDRQSGKHFYHRCGTGSLRTLQQAMRLSAARIICNLEYLKKKGETHNGK